jgi:hypothetical protein
MFQHKSRNDATKSDDQIFNKSKTMQLLIIMPMGEHRSLHDDCSPDPPPGPRNGRYGGTFVETLLNHCQETHTMEAREGDTGRERDIGGGGEGEGENTTEREREQES